MNKLMRKIMQILINIFMCHLVYRVRFENLDKVRQFEKCIICPNHSHILDPVWIYAKVSNMHMMAKSELFENKAFGSFLRYYGAFPIKRGKKDAKSLIYAIKLLQENKRSRLLIFPEGGILKKGRREKITDGATYIAGKTEVPMVPVYITEEPKLFSKIKISFKEPIYVSKEEIKDKELLKKKSQELLKTIYTSDNININI